MRLTREQITPSVQPGPHSQTSLLRILAMPNPRCKFPKIYCARSLEIPFLPRAHCRDLGADSPYYCGKNEPRRGSTPARAAQGMATTSCCGKFLPDRGQKISCRFSLMAARLAAQQIETAVRDWRLITAACDASAVRRRRRLWRLCPASNRGYLSYLDQDFVSRSF